MNLKKIRKVVMSNLLGPGPRFVKKKLPGRGLTKVGKHRFRREAMKSHCGKSLQGT
jgi:hypothetical protein